MICENCEKEHNGSYGSGRFCNNICARGFSTKLKRKEINIKVTKTFFKNNIGVVELIKQDVIDVINNSLTMLDAAQKLNIPYTSFKRYIL